jgi:alpha-glucosidase
VKLGKINLIIYHDGAITFQKNQNIIRKDLPPTRTDDQWNLITELSSEEHIYGLGERAAALNLRPGEYTFWNVDVGGSYSTGKDPMYFGIPVYLSVSSTDTYLTYFENSNKSHLSIRDRLSWTFEGGALRYYVIFGSLDEIYTNLSELIGYPFFPPQWALGYQQSRWGYKDENDIYELVELFKSKSLPISAIHLDIDYMDGYKVFTIDKQRFPDITELVKVLDSEGIKLVSTINPAIKSDARFELYQEGKSNHFLCSLPNGKPVKGVSWPGWVVYPDLLNPGAREWWSEQYKFLIEKGISGFWHDMNEPTSFAAWGGMSIPRATIHVNNGVKATHCEIHNLYGLLMNKSAFEGIKRNQDKRPWIFSRSGWAGLQRYAWNWTGDVDSTWQSLRQTVATIIGLSLSGHAFSGADIGGFSGNPDAELYLRWFQLCAFLPLFRTHSSLHTKPREPWVYGDDVTNIIRTFLELRYQLLPYLYTSTWLTCQSGKPIIRPVFWENPTVEAFWDIADEFFLGDNMLIAPVLNRGSSKRIVVFPQGAWISYWDDHVYHGMSEVEIDVSLSMIPIFIRNGCILITVDKDRYFLHIYAFEDIFSENVVYWDAGDGYGDYRIDTYQLSVMANEMQLTCSTQGKYPCPYQQISIILHGLSFSKAIHEGELIKPEGNRYTVSPFQKIVFTQ